MPAVKDVYETRRRGEGDPKNEGNSKTKHDGRDSEGRSKYEEHARNERGSRKDHWRKVKKEEKLAEGSGHGDRHLVRPLCHNFDHRLLTMA